MKSAKCFHHWKMSLICLLDDVGLAVSAQYFKQQIYLDLTTWNISLRKKIYLALALLNPCYKPKFDLQTIGVLL